jgi:quinol monooxygenase YgiN
MAYGVVHLPWYATGFRGDDLEAALAQLAPISMRYGATRYDVYRSRDDRYRFLMEIEFDAREQWDAFWFGEEFTDMRASCSSWYTVPLLYVWNDRFSSGALRRAEALVGDDERD